MSVEQGPSPKAADKPDAGTKTVESANAIAASWSDLSMTLIKSGVIGVYLTALLFITGWAYADRYFDLFGISFSGIDRDVSQAFYIYALWALRDNVLFLAVLAVGVAAILLVLLSQSVPYLRSFFFVIAGMLALLSFSGAFWLGQQRAEWQAPLLISQDYTDFPRVIVTAKKDSATAAFLAAKNAGESKDCLRKFFMDKKNLYLYSGYESTKNSIPPVYIVPLDEVAAIEIVKNRGLCLD